MVRAVPVAELCDKWSRYMSKLVEEPSVRIDDYKLDWVRGRLAVCKVVEFLTRSKRNSNPSFKRCHKSTDRYCKFDIMMDTISLSNRSGLRK